MQLIQTIILTVFLFAKNSYQKCVRKFKPPNIIVIMADDMGHNDVGLRGSNQIPTPNIDALGYNGIILDKYYVHNSCTPSRAAFLTGQYPIRSGMQGLPIISGQNRSLPLNMTLMPQHLKNLGYSTHLVGKWHLGSAYRSSTPTRKGFDSHFGYWNGFLGYFDYLTDFNNTKIEGFDLHDGFTPVRNFTGQYATDVFTNRAVEIINTHSTKKPLFLLVTHLAAHAGRDSVELGVPNTTVTNLKYNYIGNERRRLYSDIVNRLDNSVGKIIQSLDERRMLQNSIVLFFSDNGAPTVGPYTNSGSNWPLRGIKLTDFEGAIRGTAIVYSPLFKQTGYINTELIHVTDWLPTFYAAAGGDIDDLGPIDGINQWDTLSYNEPTDRTEILVNIDEVQNLSAIITNNGKYKYIKGNFENGTYNGYFGESGRDSDVPLYNVGAVLNSAVNRAIDGTITLEQVLEARRSLDLSWCRDANLTTNMDCTNGCLFDLENDPCETINIIENRRKLAKKLEQRIKKYSKFLVPQNNLTIDPNANPQRYNNTWCTWLDDSWCYKTPNNTKLY